MLEPWLQAFGMIKTDGVLVSRSKVAGAPIASWCRLYEGSDYGLPKKGYLDFLQTSCK